MGIIKRQSIKSSIVNYLGAIVGAMAVFFVYPLDKEIYGFAQFLYSTAYLLIPLATLGGLSLVVRYYPTFNTKNSPNYNGFLSLVLLILSGAYAGFVLLWIFFGNQLLLLLNKLLLSLGIQSLDISVIQDNQIYILLLLGVLILLQFLLLHSANRLRIVVPNIIEKLGFKLFLPLLVLAYVFADVSRSQFAYALIGFFGAASLLMLIYLRLIGGLHFGKVSRPSSDFSYKAMGKYSLFGSLNLLSAGLATRVDSIMIAMFLGFAKNGAYNMALVIASVVEIPTRSINQISGPIISKAWKENDLTEIDTIYKKASTNLFLFGSFVFLGIWYSLDDLVRLSSNPDSFIDVRWIFLALGIGKLTDMITSVNTQIIVYSDKYKYNLYFIAFLAVCNVILNFIMIPKYGIIGAAVATSISLIAYNIVKLIFIYISYNLHPFTISSFKTVLLLLILALLFYLFPADWNPYGSIIIKGLFVVLIFLPIAYFWNISEDLNEMLRSVTKKIF
jgi:O-antigen/teichoic acid export membrane protein